MFSTTRIMSDQHRELIHQQLTLLLHHFETLQSSFMNEHDPTGQTKAKWDPTETDQLIRYIVDHKSERQEGNFKPTFYTAAAQHLQQYHVSGKAKDGKSVKTKFDQVRYPDMSFSDRTISNTFPR